MIDLNKYKQFVKAVTSKESNDSYNMYQHIEDIESNAIFTLALLSMSSMC